MRTKFNGVRPASGNDNDLAKEIPTAATDSPRIMTYSHDGFGMGHMRRNANIASRFVKDVPGSDALMLMGCPSGPLFELPMGVDFVRLPSIVKVATNTWQSRKLNMATPDLLDLRSRLIMEAADSFAPQAFVVDHVPAGVWHELIPTLEMFRNMAKPPLIILGLRDILDAPEVVRDSWSHERTYDLIAKYYDGIFIYGCPEVYNTAGRYRLNECLPDKVHYCGYVSSEEGHRSSRQVRSLLGTGDSKLVVVTAGGGNDAYPMMCATLDALRRLGPEADLQTILITGPLMEVDERKRLEHQAEDLPVRILAYAPDLHDYLNAADLVVTMAGYNTLMELIALNKRTLVIPREGPSAEQRTRAEVLAKMGLVQTVDPQQTDPAPLAQKILDCLNGDAPARGLLSMNGAEQATSKLIDMIEGRDTVSEPVVSETVEQVLVAG